MENNQEREQQERIGKAEEELQIFKVSYQRLLDTVKPDVFVERFTLAEKTIQEIDKIPSNLKISGRQPKEIFRELIILKDSLAINMVDRFVAEEGISQASFQALTDYRESFSDKVNEYIQAIYLENHNQASKVALMIRQRASELIADQADYLKITADGSNQNSNQEQASNPYADFYDDKGTVIHDEKGKPIFQVQQMNPSGCVMPASGCLSIILFWLLLSMLLGGL